MPLYQLEPEFFRGRKLEELYDVDAYFAEGEIGELHIWLQNPLPAEKLNEIASLLKDVQVFELYQTGSELVITAQKAMPWLPVIGGLGLAGVLGWWLFRKQIGEIRVNWSRVALGGALGATGIVSGIAGLRQKEFLPQAGLVALGLGLFGTGAYLAIREFLPKPPPPKVRAFGITHDRYGSPAGWGGWRRTF